jgi:hypothetical protein
MREDTLVYRKERTRIPSLNGGGGRAGDENKVGKFYTMSVQKANS